MTQDEKLDEILSKEKWASLASDALGIRPANVEFQARTVAEYAVERITVLLNQIQETGKTNSHLRKKIEQLEKELQLLYDSKVSSLRTFDTIRAEKAEAQLAAKDELLREEERKHEQTIIERDNYHEWADKLAHAIGGEEVGGHSNVNNPWQNAIDIALAKLQSYERPSVGYGNSTAPGRPFEPSDTEQAAPVIPLGRNNYIDYGGFSVSERINDAVITIRPKPAAPEPDQQEAAAERIKRGMEEILREQSERDIPFAPSTRPVEREVTEGLSEWGGWDKSREPWSDSKHKDEVLEAMFRGPWSVEDASELIGFIDRTWSVSLSVKAGRS